MAELKRVEQTADDLVLGACVTHADIEDGRVPDVTNGAMRAVAAGIAYRAVRNRGTIGGSLTNADPAADWVSALAALGARRRSCAAPAGARTVPVEDFMTGAFETALAADELLEAIRVPELSARRAGATTSSAASPANLRKRIGAVLLDPDAACSAP